MNERQAGYHVPDLKQRVRESLVPSPAGDQIQSGVDTLHALAVGSRSDGRESYEAYQRLLYELHYGDDEATYIFRQWLASTVYPLEEESIEKVPVNSALATEEYRARLQAEQEILSPLHHPLFKLLYYGEPTFDQFKVYLRHKWIIMLTFWRSLAEFGSRLQRFDLENTALVYKNVYEELGEGDVHSAHLNQHIRQLHHIGLDVTFRDEPVYPETCEYINFRLMCMRHREPAWGLGSFFSMEATSLEYTLGHFRQLTKFEVGEEYCEVYRAHEDIDTEHTSEILQVIDNLVKSAEDQSTCLTAQRQQMSLWHRHFDRVHEEIMSAPC